MGPFGKQAENPDVMEVEIYKHKVGMKHAAQNQQSKLERKTTSDRVCECCLTLNSLLDTVCEGLCDLNLHCFTSSQSAIWYQGKLIPH